MDKLQTATVKYHNLTKAEAGVGIVNKITHCLPKHKEKEYEAVRGRAITNRYNARSEFKKAIEGFTPEQLDQLAEVVKET